MCVSVKAHDQNQHQSQHQSQSQQSPTLVDIPEIRTSSSTFFHDFASSGAWGTHPILIRNAFQLEAQALQDATLSSSSPWPDWEEVMELASDEEAESRLIIHDPDADANTNQNTNHQSWSLQLGPIQPHHISQHETPDSNKKWTVVVNDVDRFHPPLSEWISTTFSHIPHWRRDDGQISLSNTGGGIGPHVDDYDVFLIQMSGKRRWDVGKRIISTKEELEGLVQDLDVRILEFWNDKDVKQNWVDSFVLEPGDLIYLPPKFGHCGTALLDGSMTLSVGLRAPSAKEMMTKMMDCVSDAVEGKILDRYTDPCLLDGHGYIREKRDDESKDGNAKSNTNATGNRSTNELDSVVKLKAKELIRNAIHEMLDDDSQFDEFFGKLVTESKRMRLDYPVPLDDVDDEYKKELGAWGDPSSAVEAMMNGEGVLYVAEGVALAYSHLDLEKVCRLFIDGKMMEIALDAGDDEADCEDRLVLNLVEHLVNDRQLCSTSFKTKFTMTKMRKTLEHLVQDGYLYGISE